MPPLDLADAVWMEDAPALREALAAGQSLPHFIPRQHGQSTEDVSMVLHCIARGWLDGWVMLRTAWPHLLEDDRPLATALLSAQPRLVADILACGQSPTALFSATSLSPVWTLFQNIRGQPGEPISEQRLLDTALALRQAGADLAAPYPGSFAPADVTYNGHTLWTQSIASGRWRLARALAPDSWSLALTHPRLLEALESWFEAAWIHGSSLSQEPNHIAREGWLAWMGPHATHWLSLSETLLLPSAWPALLALDPCHRPSVWQAMATPSRLCELAASAADHPDALVGLLETMNRELPDPTSLITAWNGGSPPQASPRAVFQHQYPSPPGVLPSWMSLQPKP